MPSIKLIASDMDGTLLNSNHELSTSFYPVFDQLKENNIRFVAASGRQYFNLEQKFASIKDDVIFVAENGSYVVNKNQELHVQATDPAIIFELVAKARTLPDTYTIICGKKKAYVENSAPEFIDQLKLYFERYEIVDDLTTIDHDQFLKFTLCDLAGSQENSYPHFAHYANSLQVKVSGPTWLDISDKLANKGVAIEVLQKKFGITYEETMVFGDYFNDVEMLQKAYYSYAMENAHPEVKKFARFVTGSNEDGAVIKVIQEMLTNSRLSKAIIH
jgi:Cof subfamily protein (haloacid dehalogenase superfamily)